MISADQVTALAPDASSFKAGKALAAKSKWSGLGHAGQMIWGLAKGSGSKPYQTQVNIEEFAYKCSCPSRKFPCKHALGLLFLAADDETLLTETDLPDWVKAWVDTRQEKQSKKAEKTKAAKSKAAAKAKDPEAAAKTRKKREARVQEGVSFLQDFLLDIARQGLGQSNIRERGYWDTVSRRLIDCQAPGLASAVGRISETANSATDTRLLHEIGALYLLTHSYINKDNLTEAQQQEIDQRIGWQVAKETVLKSKHVTDDWFVAFRTVTKPAQVTVYSTWLKGFQSQRWALLLSFSAAGSSPSALWPVGSTVTTELAFYPGSNPDRALPVDESAAANMEHHCDVQTENVNELLARVADNLPDDPWQVRLPFVLSVQPTTVEKKTVLVDAEGVALPWHAVGSQQLILSTVCGGKPSRVAGVWDGFQCEIHAAEDNGSWFPMRDQYT